MKRQTMVSRSAAFIAAFIASFVTTTTVFFPSHLSLLAEIGIILGVGLIFAVVITIVAVIRVFILGKY